MERKQEEKNGRKRGKAFKNVEREAPACIAPSSASRSRRGSEEGVPAGGAPAAGREGARLSAVPRRAAASGLRGRGFHGRGSRRPRKGFHTRGSRRPKDKKKVVNLNRTDTIFEKDDRQITRAENLPVCPELYRSLWLVIGP